MTIIKLKGDLVPVENCTNCPFIDYIDEMDYGWATAYCKAIPSLNEGIIGDTRDENCGDGKLDNCPLISVEVIEGSE